MAPEKSGDTALVFLGTQLEWGHRAVTPIRPDTNPYLDAARRHPMLKRGGGWQFLFDPGIPWRDYRGLQRRYAWAIPNEDALDAIARWSPIVEIGAGTGYWAAMLAARGADVIAYDREPHHNRWCSGCYFPVRPGDAQQASLHPDRTLMLCWPPYDDPMAAEALRAYRGRRLVYIGEGKGGCCADDTFFRMLGRRWKLMREVRIPQWEGLYDQVFMYERRD